MVSNTVRYPSLPSYTLYTYIYSTFSWDEGEGVVVNQREGERGNRGKYRSKNWAENTSMTDCTQEIGYLQSITVLN
jgi:hypothetical protein